MTTKFCCERVLSHREEEEEEEKSTASLSAMEFLFIATNSRLHHHLLSKSSLIDSGFCFCCFYRVSREGNTARPWKSISLLNPKSLPTQPQQIARDKSPEKSFAAISALGQSLSDSGDVLLIDSESLFPHECISLSVCRSILSVCAWKGNRVEVNVSSWFYRKQTETLVVSAAVRVSAAETRNRESKRIPNYSWL